MPENSGSPKKNHNAVAHEFVQGAAVFVAERGHLVEVVLREIGAQLHVDLFAADFRVDFDEGAGRSGDLCDFLKLCVKLLGVIRHQVGHAQFGFVFDPLPNREDIECHNRQIGQYDGDADEHY